MRWLGGRAARSFGMLALGIWLVLTGLLPLLSLDIPQAGTVLSILAIIAGVLIIAGR